jgi:dehydrogenase/reductase SDR family protein 13
MPAMSQDLKGKTYVVTGATAGIGRITATELARRGAHVIVTGRSKEKAQPIVDAIKEETANRDVEAISLELGDLDSVRAAAKDLLDRKIPIHGLINNAGMAGTRGVSKSGFELAWGSNHVGPYLFTRLLLDRIKESAPSRIVNVASKSHYRAKAIPWDALQSKTRSITGVPEYEVSKLANVLFSKSLAKRLEGTGVTVYSLHPGVVATDVWRRMPAPIRWIAKKFMITPAEGAVASLKTATDPALATESGKYYDVGGVERHPSRVAQDPALAEELWQKSAAWVGLPVE